MAYHPEHPPAPPEMREEAILSASPMPLTADEREILVGNFRILDENFRRVHKTQEDHLTRLQTVEGDLQNVKSDLASTSMQMKGMVKEEEMEEAMKKTNVHQEMQKEMTGLKKSKKSHEKEILEMRRELEERKTEMAEVKMQLGNIQDDHANTRRNLEHVSEELKIETVKHDMHKQELERKQRDQEQKEKSQENIAEMKKRQSEIKKNKEDAKKREFTFALPNSVYTAALITVLCLKRPECSWKGFFVFLGVQFTSFVSFILCMAAQSFVIYYLWQDVEAKLEPSYIGDDKIEPCSLKLSIPLQLIGAAAFVGIMMEDLEQSLLMLWWLYQKQQLNDEDEEDDDSQENSSFAKLGVNQIKVEGSELESFCMSKRRRFLAGFFCVLPKLAIGACLTIVGTRFVVLAENNSELLLNCVAMIFVNEIDDMAHKRISPIRMKNLVKHLPEAVSDTTEGSWDLKYLDNYFGAPVKAALWVGAVEGLRVSAYLPFGCCWPWTN